MTAFPRDRMAAFVSGEIPVYITRLLYPDRKLLAPEEWIGEAHEGETVENVARRLAVHPLADAMMVRRHGNPQGRPVLLLIRGS